MARATARASHARAVVTVTVTVAPLRRFPQRNFKLNAPLSIKAGCRGRGRPASAAVAAARAAPGAARPCHAAMGPPQHRRAHSADPRERPRVGRAIHSGWHFQASARQKPASVAGFKLSVGAAAGRAPARGAAAVAAPGPRRAFPLAAESTRSRSVPVAVHYCIYSQLGRGPPNLSIVQMLGLLRVGYAAASYHHRHAKRALNRAQAATSCRCAECVQPVPRTIEPVRIELASMLQGASR